MAAALKKKKKVFPTDRPISEKVVEDKQTIFFSWPNVTNTCNYYFDCSLDFDVSLNDNFSLLHLNSRSFNKNRDNIDIFLANLKHTFSV